MRPIKLSLSERGSNVCVQPFVAACFLLACLTDWSGLVCCCCCCCCRQLSFVRFACRFCQLLASVSAQQW